MRSFRLFALSLLVAASAVAAPKPPLRGLLSMGAFKFTGNDSDPVNSLDAIEAKEPGIFGGIVILGSWREMQTAPNAGITADNGVDKGLALVREYNRKHPDHPLGVKLRIWSGRLAPDWAKQIGGPMIHVVHNKKEHTVGRFWSPEYRARWRHFQQLLAEKYDKDPLIQEVAVTSCQSDTAEPFYIPDEASYKNPLEQAGFKPFQFKKCLMESLDDYSVWKETNVETPLNPVYMPLGAKTADHQFTFQYMTKCRQQLGARCVFDNHDLDTPAGTPKSIVPIYDQMKKMGGAIEMQTFHETPTNWENTFKYALSIGAGSIELWQDYGGFPKVPDAQLKQWAAMFR